MFRILAFVVGPITTKSHALKMKVTHKFASIVLFACFQKGIDRDRTRTCNPQIRSLVPYPLGHTVLGWF